MPREVVRPEKTPFLIHEDMYEKVREYDKVRDRNVMPANKVLEVIKIKPLFGHVTGKHGRTIWMCFMKI